jgi:hypothetical protein
MTFRKELRLAHHPSDESLIANFHDHRIGFERLVKMASEDHEVLTIYPKQIMFTDYRIWPKDCEQCFSSQRWGEYQGIFANLGEAQPYRLSKESNMVLIPTSYSSTEPEDDFEYIISEKGYAYSVKQPRCAVESLNEVGFESTGTFYKRIDGNWYLYHKWGVGKPE